MISYGLGERSLVRCHKQIQSFVSDGTFHHGEYGANEAYESKCSPTSGAFSSTIPWLIRRQLDVQPRFLGRPWLELGSCRVFNVLSNGAVIAHARLLCCGRDLV